MVSSKKGKKMTDKPIYLKLTTDPGSISHSAKFSSDEYAVLNNIAWRKKTTVTELIKEHAMKSLVEHRTIYDVALVQSFAARSCTCELTGASCFSNHKDRSNSWKCVQSAYAKFEVVVQPKGDTSTESLCIDCLRAYLMDTVDEFARSSKDVERVLGIKEHN